MPHRNEQLVLENEAFEREYYDDFSWEQLKEDEHGRLRPLVSYPSHGGTFYARAAAIP